MRTSARFLQDESKLGHIESEISARKVHFAEDVKDEETYKPKRLQNNQRTSRDTSSVSTSSNSSELRESRQLSPSNKDRDTEFKAKSRHTNKLKKGQGTGSYLSNRGTKRSLGSGKNTKTNKGWSKIGTFCVNRQIDC